MTGDVIVGFWRFFDPMEFLQALPKHYSTSEGKAWYFLRQSHTHFLHLIYSDRSESACGASGGLIKKFLIKKFLDHDIYQRVGFGVMFAHC